MANLAWHGVFFEIAIFEKAVESIDLSHLVFLIQLWRVGRCDQCSIRFNVVRGCSGRSQLLQTVLHDLLKGDMFGADLVDRPLFDDARPVLEGDLYKGMS